MVAPIHSKKHYVGLTNSTLASGSATTFDIVNAVVAPATSNAQDIVEGTIVKAIHHELWLWGSEISGNDGQFTVAIEKVPAGQTAMTFAQAANMGAYPNKKNIFYTTQGVLGGRDNNSIPVIRDWMLLPKGKQRMGLGDHISITIAAVGAALQRCGLFTYKEYS